MKLYYTIYLSGLSHRWSHHVLPESIRWSCWDGCPASRPSDTGSEPSPGWSRCRSRGAWAGRSASRSRMSKHPLRGQKNWVLRANKRWNVWYCVFMGTWVGHDDEDAVGTVSDDLRDDVFEDVDVSLHQIQSALALLLTHACRHHHDTRVSRHRVIYRTNPDVQEVQTTEKPLKMSRVWITQWPSGGSDHMGGGYCVNRAF